MDDVNCKLSSITATRRDVDWRLANWVGTSQADSASAPATVIFAHLSKSTWTTDCLAPASSPTKELLLIVYDFNIFIELGQQQYGHKVTLHHTNKCKYVPKPWYLFVAYIYTYIPGIIHAYTPAGTHVHTQYSPYGKTTDHLCNFHIRVRSARYLLQVYWSK